MSRPLPGIKQFKVRVEPCFQTQKIKARAHSADFQIMCSGAKKVPAESTDKRQCQELIKYRTNSFIMEEVKLLDWFEMYGFFAIDNGHHDISREY